MVWLIFTIPLRTLPPNSTAYIVPHDRNNPAYKYVPSIKTSRCSNSHIDNKLFTHAKSRYGNRASVAFRFEPKANSSLGPWIICFLYFSNISNISLAFFTLMCLGPRSTNSLGGIYHLSLVFPRAKRLIILI